MALDLSSKKFRETASPFMRDDGSVDLRSIDFSAIDMYQRCGKQYWFRYIKGRKSPPSVALAEGSSHHASAEEDNWKKLREGKSLTAKLMTEIFVATFRKLVPEYERECEELKVNLDWEGEDEETVIHRAKILHGHYSSKFSPLLKPELVEHAVSKEYEVNGIKFRLFGQLDMAEKGTVWDYKAVKRARTERDARESVQLGLYGKMVGKKETGFISFVKEKPHVEMVKVERTPAEMNWGLEVAAATVDAIRRGAFPLARVDAMSWFCSARFCGYWGHCRGKDDRVQS